jgi:transcriptional regulator with XRE-family HTH domain
MHPGLLLRQARERLGLTYREVERTSYELALRRGRPEFIMHISRLADIENRGVVPSLHKLYTLAAVYLLNPLDILRWYDIPIEECFQDGTSFSVPRTHLMEPPTGLLTNEQSRQMYGYIGTSDQRMSLCCVQVASC